MARSQGSEFESCLPLYKPDLVNYFSKKTIMLRNFIVLFIFTTAALNAGAQLPFKYDNTVYKALYLNEAFRLMESSPNYLLLDVRSPGEYADTSRHTALNIGRIKGAVNIDIDAIP